MEYIYKLNKRIIYIMALLFVVAACNDKDSDLDILTASDGALIDISTTSASYLLGITDQIDLEVNVKVNEGSPVASVAVYKQLNSAIGISDEVLLGNFSTFPSTINLSSNEMFSDVPVGGNILGENDLDPGDNWVFRYVINMADGRIVNDGTSFVVTFTCESALEGTFDYVSTGLLKGDGTTGSPCGGTSGTVTWTNEGNGNYSTTDLSFGQFGNCWGDNPANSADARIFDVCNVIAVLGTDQYGDSYTYTIVDVSGPNLTIDFVNTFADGGTVVLTRQDGNDWPSLTN